LYNKQVVMFKLNKPSILTSDYRKYSIGVVFIVLVAMVGTHLIISSHAAGPYASTEASNGTLSGATALLNDGNASNGKYVQFGSATSQANSSGCTSNGIVAPCIGSTTTGASGWGTPTFDDEFSGSTLSSKWSTGWFNSSTSSGPVNNLENDCYTPDHVSVGTSGLDLSFTQQTETCVSDGGNPEPYDAGLITTDPEGGTTPGYKFTYGYAEALMYLPPSGSEVANWPAFWAVTPPSETYGEMDIMEGLGGSACYHFLSSTANPGGCASGNFSGWHTFAANWQNGVCTYYYDGKEVGTVTSDISSQAMYLIVNNSDGSDGGPTVAPTNVLVRYVRVWQ
jgi:hypothetical protein